MTTIRLDGYTQANVDAIEDTAGNKWIDATTAVVPSGTLQLGQNPSGTYQCREYENVSMTYKPPTAQTEELLATMNNHTYYPSSGKTFSKVTTQINTDDIKTQEKTVIINDGNNVGYVQPDIGYDAMTGLSYNVQSGVDRNIQPYNIKKGVSILGTLGTFEGKKT